MFNSHLSEFTLASALRFLEPQHLAGVKEPDWLRRGCQACRDGFCDERREFRAKREDIAFTIDEPIDLLFVPPAFREDIVVVKDRRNDLLVRPALEDRTDRSFENPPPPSGASDKDLCSRRNLG